MCTHARIPCDSCRNDNASSKSFAVSGSTVYVGRSRRSTRPSSDGSGGACGSNSCRAPRSTSSASSTFSIRSDGPTRRRTFARPRPVTTSTRSPCSTSCSPFVSRTTGVPGAKYGSPMTSLPRRETWTIRVGSDLEEAADRQTRAGSADQEAGAEQDQRDQRERERPHVGARVEVVQDRRQRQLLAEHEQDDRGKRAGEAAQQALEHERAAHEPVGRAHELHHLDLASAREDRQPDRVRY